MCLNEAEDIEHILFVSIGSVEGTGHLGVNRSAPSRGAVWFGSLGGGNPKGRPSSSYGRWLGQTHFDWGLVHLVGVQTVCSWRKY